VSKGLVRITVFTDAACPFAFSAEPDLLALRWLYGDQIEWTTRFVVLSESREALDASPITLEMIEANDAKLAREHGMPINSAKRPHLLVAKPGDLAVKAVQLNQPEKADRFLRAMRVAWQTDHRPVDNDEVMLDVAEEVGIDREALDRWRKEPATIEAIDADMRAARAPMSAALGALDHKLAGPEDSRRYTCPSLEITAASNPQRKLVAPGFQNHSAYDLMIANAAPEIERREYATDPLEVLRWADWPLAAVEVGRVMGIDRATAEQKLEEAGAINDRGYWSDPALRDEDQLAGGPASADRLVGSPSV
jgi:predicted DsbA family dithiol-disulfide isomerase